MRFRTFLENNSTGYQLFLDFFNSHDLNTLGILVDWLEENSEFPKTVQYLRDKISTHGEFYTSFHQASNELKEKYDIERIWSKNYEVTEIDFYNYKVEFIGGNFYFKTGYSEFSKYVAMRKQYIEGHLPLFVFYLASYIKTKMDYAGKVTPHFSVVNILSRSIFSLHSSIYHGIRELNVIHFLQEIENYINKYKIYDSEDLGDIVYYLVIVRNNLTERNEINKVNEIITLLGK